MPPHHPSLTHDTSRPAGPAPATAEVVPVMWYVYLNVDDDGRKKDEGWTEREAPGLLSSL